MYNYIYILLQWYYRIYLYNCIPKQHNAYNIIQDNHLNSNSNTHYLQYQLIIYLVNISRPIRAKVNSLTNNHFICLYPYILYTYPYTHNLGIYGLIVTVPCHIGLISMRPDKLYSHDKRKIVTVYLRPLSLIAR